MLKKAGSAASDVLPTVLFQPTQQPTHLTIRGANFYWAANSTGFIYARSASAAMVVTGTAIMSVDQGTYMSMATSPTTLYWVSDPTGTPTPTLNMMPIPAGGTPQPVPDAVVGTQPATNGLFTVGETLYFIRRVGTNALNGIYSFALGDTTVQQLVAHDFVLALLVDAKGIYYRIQGDNRTFRAKLSGGTGVPIASNASFGGFAGQDDTYL